MKKVIIGIHGIKNKPPKEILEKWWKLSIVEGFERLGFKIPEFEFELVYWADLQYDRPLSLSVEDENDSYLDKEPYVKKPIKEIPRHKEHPIRKKLAIKIEEALKKIYLSKERPKLEELTEETIKKMFPDLYDYYNGSCRTQKELKAKDAFRKRLKDILEKHKHKKILLIAHSMGNIIAYDTMMFCAKKIPVHTLISIGSPLGYAPIYKEILKELNLEIDDDTKAPTPNNIFYRWYNFSDIRDPIAINYNLKDNFYPNIFNVFPTDICVENDYEYKGKEDHHKSYGYLRTFEVAFAIEDFLNGDDKFFDRIYKKILLFFSR